MRSLSDLLDYGPYVWTAFAICTAALALELIELRARRHRAQQLVRARAQRMDVP